MHQKRSQWASNVGFILAAAGSAVGLGNIWKFPGKVGAYGGGAFILCYIIIVALIGFPVMLAELSIGRRTQKNVIGAFRQLDKRFTFVGGIGVLTLFVIMSYYSIVGGWVMKYIWVYASGAHFGAAANPYQTYFADFIAKPVEPLLWGAAFLLLLACVIRAVTLPGAKEGLTFMLTIRPESFNGNTLVGALGQAFFSLSVGMGIMVTYGSYVPKDDHLVKSAVSICALDTMVAILAAFAIIPVVFVTLGAEGLGMGGGFAFMALPEVFAGFPGGKLFGLVFFILLFFAALTSAISILESCVAFISEEFHFSRLKSTIVLSVPMTVLSAGYSLSQSDARGIKLPWFDFSQGFTMLPMNAVMEKFTDNLMIPLGALAFCLFVGWVWGTKNAVEEIESEGRYPMVMRRTWSFIVRFLAPLVIAVILYFTLGRGEGLS